MNTSSTITTHNQSMRLEPTNKNNADRSQRQFQSHQEQASTDGSKNQRAKEPPPPPPSKPPQFTDSVTKFNEGEAVTVSPETLSVPDNTRLFQNVCFDNNKAQKSEHLMIYPPSNSTIADAKSNPSLRPPFPLWINATTTPSSKKEHIWIEEPTLLLTGPWTNPNHLFWDVMVHLFPMKDRHDLPFTHWSAPSHYPCDYWLCHHMPPLLDVLGLKSHLLPLHNLSGSTSDDSYGIITADHMPCFRNVWIPNFSIYRAELKPIPNEREVLPLLRSRLTQSFHSHNESTSPTPRTILIYGHEDSSLRHWENAKEEAERIDHSLTPTQRPRLVVDYIPNMKALSREEQCFKFWTASHIIYVHGGHTANLICAQPGTRIDEFSCQAYFGWSSMTKVFHNTLGFDYHQHQVPGCHGHNSNMTTPPHWIDAFFTGATEMRLRDG